MGQVTERPAKRFAWTPEVEAEFDQLHAAGHSDYRIAALLGCDRSSVTHRRAARGMPPVPPERRATGWGLARGRGTAHSDALSAAGWAWPLTVGGEAVDLPPLAVRLLLTLVARGPMTRRDAAAAVGLRWTNSACKVLNVGHPNRDALTEMAARGLVGATGGPAFVYAVTALGLRLLAAAAEEQAESPDRLPGPERVRAMVG